MEDAILILNDIQPIHWALAGSLIGLLTLAMLFIVNRRLGVSTGFESLCALGVSAPYFQRPSLRQSSSRRLALFVGLMLGGMLSAALSGGISLTWDMGAYAEALTLSETGKVAWMFAGGCCIGFGTRLAGGCTSGHGIFGISNLEASSWISTFSFMGAGIVTTHIIYRLVWVA